MDTTGQMDESDPKKAKDGHVQDEPKSILNQKNNKISTFVQTSNFWVGPKHFKST